VHATDTTEHTAAVIAALDDETEVGEELRPFHALQDWLASGETRVDIPFSKALLRKVRPVAIRLRRDVSQVLSLLRAHALLHRHTRARNARGWIVATVEDYRAAHALIEPLIAAGTGATVPRTVRDTVQMVAECPTDPVTVKAVASMLSIDKSSAWRRVQRAIDAEYLVNEEDRKGRPARLKLGAPLPDDVSVLPLPDDLLPTENASITPDSLQPCNLDEKPLSDGHNGLVAQNDGCTATTATTPGPSDRLQ